MTHEFEGKTEKEAIDAAVEALGLNRDEFDVEILETQKSGLFNFSKKVVIRVHTRDEAPGRSGAREGRDVREGREGRGHQSSDSRENRSSASRPARSTTVQGQGGDYNPEPQNDLEHALVDFIRETTAKMGYPAQPVIAYREPEKLGIRLDSQYSGILIGKKGKNLDALQLLANVIAAKMVDGDFRVIVDTENYRIRREESLIRLAEKVGDQVIRTKKSRLLEPMNPFERRLIHTALSNIDSIETKSEGEGVYKQVRVIYKGF